jgi:hypothetical protein
MNCGSTLSTGYKKFLFTGVPGQRPGKEITSLMSYYVSFLSVIFCSLCIYGRVSTAEGIQQKSCSFTLSLHSLLYNPWKTKLRDGSGKGRNARNSIRVYKRKRYGRSKRQFISLRLKFSRLRSLVLLTGRAPKWRRQKGEKYTKWL